MRVRRHLGLLLALLSVPVFLHAGFRHLDLQDRRQALAQVRADLVRLELALAEPQEPTEPAAVPESPPDKPQDAEAAFSLPPQAPRLALLEVLEGAAHEAGVLLDRVELPPRPRVEATRAQVVGRGSPTQLIDFLARIEARAEVTLWASAWLRVNEAGVLSLHAQVVAPSSATVPALAMDSERASETSDEGGDA